jgi:transaldolase
LSVAEAGFHLYLDSADLAALRTVLPHPLVHGVTTNPTLLKRAGVRRSELPALLRELLELGLRQVQAQVGASGRDAILADAASLLAGIEPGRLVIKIPATRDGFAAGAELAARGVPVTWTAVYAPEQAHFAAQLGAAYAAPYLGRMEDAGVDGLAMVAQMQARVAGTGTRLLVASVRSPEAYRALLQIGVGAVTIPPHLMAELLDHDATRAAERAFLADVRD